MVADRHDSKVLEKLKTNVTNNNSQNRTLDQAFAELRQARIQYELDNNTKKTKKHSTKKKSYDVYYSGSIKTKKSKSINQDKLSFKEWIQYRINKLRYDKREIKKLALITTGVFALCITVVSTNYIFAESRKEEEIRRKIATNVFETNKKPVNIQRIAIENGGITKSKTIVEDEEREVPYDVKKQDNPNLPKGEEKLVTEGKFGKKLVDCVKTYEDGKYIGEKIVSETITQKPETEVIDVGTSEFLAKFGVHIGDKMYVTETLSLKKEAKDTSDSLCIILETFDVTLKELGEEWCKVKYGDYTGYVKADKLTSETVTPGIGEKSRVQKLYATLNPNMDLTKPSGLTLADYKKMLSGNPLDTNKIIENNAENFYKAEQKYGLNGIFLASIAIHESAWGTSQIALDKKNLFGFGAYDRSPYESANTFDDYSKGIDEVAKYLVKNYLYEAGTTIYNNETATGIYYNGPTLVGVNTKYCTDKEWATKLYRYMVTLYGKLGSTEEASALISTITNLIIPSTNSSTNTTTSSESTQTQSTETGTEAEPELEPTAQDEIPEELIPQDTNTQEPEQVETEQSVSTEEEGDTL